MPLEIIHLILWDLIQASLDTFKFKEKLDAEVDLNELSALNIETRFVKLRDFSYESMGIDVKPAFRSLNAMLEFKSMSTKLSNAVRSCAAEIRSYPEYTGTPNVSTISTRDYEWLTLYKQKPLRDPVKIRKWLLARLSAKALKVLRDIWLKANPKQVDEVFGDVISPVPIELFPIGPEPHVRFEFFV